MTLLSQRQPTIEKLVSLHLIFEFEQTMLLGGLLRLCQLAHRLKHAEIEQRILKVSAWARQSLSVGCTCQEKASVYFKHGKKFVSAFFCVFLVHWYRVEALAEHLNVTEMKPKVLVLNKNGSCDVILVIFVLPHYLWSLVSTGHYPGNDQQLTIFLFVIQVLDSFVSHDHFIFEHSGLRSHSTPSICYFLERVWLRKECFALCWHVLLIESKKFKGLGLCDTKVLRWSLRGTRTYFLILDYVLNGLGGCRNGGRLLALWSLRGSWWVEAHRLFLLVLLCAIGQWNASTAPWLDEFFDDVDWVLVWSQRSTRCHHKRVVLRLQVGQVRESALFVRVLNHWLSRYDGTPRCELIVRIVVLGRHNFLNVLSLVTSGHCWSKHAFSCGFLCVRVGLTRSLKKATHSVCHWLSWRRLVDGCLLALLCRSLLLLVLVLAHATSSSWLSAISVSFFRLGVSIYLYYQLF